MKRKISILGSTGSIGTQSLEVVDVLKDVEVVGLTANSNIEVLLEQIKKYKPKKVAVMDLMSYAKLKELLKDDDIEVLSGINGIVSIATLNEIDLVINALVGNIGLLPTVKAIKAGKNIALANKETLVTAGQLIMGLVKENNVSLYPIDSEHSAIFQCIQGNDCNKINKIYLTASGGPFRTKTFEELKKVTIEDALKHPNWSMGKKITIDSATLMNKGLEVIEAKWLFDVDVDDINVLVHQQSIIHSMVEYKDGAVIAQLGEPDMKVPISYALTYPKRIELPYNKIDFMKNNTLTFEQPNTTLFPCLNLAFKAIKIGGTMCAVLNGANEVAVSKFLSGEIGFLEIPRLLEQAMNAYTVKNTYDVSDVLEADKWARDFIENI